MKNDLIDFEVERYKTTLMQRIQQAASRGYCWYTSGLVHAEKAENLTNKFSDKYGTNLNDNQRSYRRKKNIANSFLYLYPKKDSKYFLWWLLVTDGTGEVHQSENLISVHNKQSRLTWDDDYELIVLPKNNSKPSVTWRMTRKCYMNWNDRIRKAIRTKYSDDAARQSAWSLKRIPGFRGIREQVKKLNVLYKSEWKRIRKSDEGMPKLDFVGYVRGLKSNKIKLSVIVTRVRKGKRPFPRVDAKPT